MDLDKIISAWEHCTSDEGDCDDCPYNNDFNGCMLNLKQDTIKVLKFYKEHEHDVCANCLYEEVEPIRNKINGEGRLFCGSCNSIIPRWGKYCAECERKVKRE